MSNLTIPADRQIRLLDEIGTQLVEASDFNEISQLRDQAEAIRQFAKIANLGLERVNQACEIKLRAERRAGAIITDLRLRGGRRESNDHADRLTIESLGITQNQSTRWQREAKIPEPQFEAYLQRAKDEGRELSSAGLIRYGSSSPGKKGKSSAARSRKRAQSPSTAPSWHYRAPVTISVESCQLIEDIHQHLSTLLSLLQEREPASAQQLNGHRRNRCNGSPGSNGHSGEPSGKPDLLSRYAREALEFATEVRKQARRAADAGPSGAATRKKGRAKN